MSLRQWLLAVALVTVGCAKGGVSDRDVARLPLDERQQIVTAQKSIDIADSNLASAKVGRDEARQFRRIANSELQSAQAKLDAARAGVDLGKSSRDDRTLRQASRNEDAARNQVIAARAKLDYANRLAQLREAKVSEAQANVAAAKADVELTKARTVQRHNGNAKIDDRKLERNRQDAQAKLAEQRARVAALEGDVAQLRTAWDDRRREFNTASRGELRELRAPPPPAEMKMPAFKNDPRGDVNDTPGAPANKQSQQPQNNIAPPP